MTHYKDPRNRGVKGAKSALGIYCLNEDLRLRFKKISRLMIPYYRTRLWKRRVFVCLECGCKFTGLVKKEKTITMRTIKMHNNENQYISYVHILIFIKIMS